MISVEALERMLEKHDLTRVVCRESWGEIVLRKYRELLEHADGTFADARCPEAVSLVHSLQPEIQIADIEPILIHCARELAERPDLADGEKIITTPCRILADMGNKLELKDTHFVPWNRFLAALGEPMEPAPDASPIPPGFFKDLPFSVVSRSGRPAIESYVTGRVHRFAAFCRSSGRPAPGTGAHRNLRCPRGRRYTRRRRPPGYR